MRIKGSLARGLLLALALTFIPISAISAQKPTPGSTCKVYNQKITNQNRIYTCIKSGKKLAWNKGEMAVKPSSNASPIPIFSTPPSSTPTPTPSPISTTTTQISSEFTAIAFDWKAKLAANQKWEPPLEIYISPNVSSSLETQYLNKVIVQIQIGRKILKSFGFEFNPKYSFALFTEKDKEWVKENFAFSCGLPEDWFLESSTNVQDGGQCFSSTKGYVNFQIIGTKNSLSDLDPNFGPVHEMFHSVQQILMKVDFGDLQSNYSCWFVESMPNLFNYLVLGAQGQTELDRASNLRIDNFKRFVMGSNLLQKYGFSNNPKNWTLDEWVSLAISKPAFGEKCRTVDGQYIGFGYWVGSILNERLILDFGMSKYLTFLSSIGKSKDFSFSFKELAGVNEEEWLRNIALPYFFGQVKYK